MNRKGIAYTMVAILLMIVVAIMFFTQQKVSFNDVQNAQRERILSVNEFISNIESDSERAAYIAGFRTMIALEQHVTTAGSYLTDVDSAFREVFLTGNLSGSTFEVMENSSFNDYLARVQTVSGKQGITFNASVLNLSAWHAEPWMIVVNITLGLNITDSRGSARWETQKIVMGEIPIEDIRDPLFTKETLGRVQRVIRQTNITEFVDDAGDANDTTEFTWHFNNSRYVANGRGPTLLMRFEGNLSDHPRGIESLIDILEFDAQGLTIYNSRSVVDYEYFSSTVASRCNIQNLPVRLKLDAASSTLYEVETELDYSVC